MPTRDVRAANLYGCYQTGWKDGAASRAKRPAFVGHDDPLFVAAYELGYVRGGAAYTLAMRAASKTFKYKPSVLRKAT